MSNLGRIGFIEVDVYDRIGDWKRQIIAIDDISSIYDANLKNEFGKTAAQIELKSTRTPLIVTQTYDDLRTFMVGAGLMFDEE